MSRYAGLMDADRGDQFVHLALPAAQCVDHASSGGIGKGEEQINMHIYAYV